MKKLSFFIELLKMYNECSVSNKASYKTLQSSKCIYKLTYYHYIKDLKKGIILPYIILHLI